MERKEEKGQEDNIKGVNFPLSFGRMEEKEKCIEEYKYVFPP